MAGQCPTASFQQVTSLLCAPVFSSVRFQLQGSDSIKPLSLLLLTPPFLLGYTQLNIPPLLQCLQHLLLDCEKVQMPWVTFKALHYLVPTHPFSLPPHYLFSMADILFLLWFPWKHSPLFPLLFQWGCIHEQGIVERTLEPDLNSGPALISCVTLGRSWALWGSSEKNEDFLKNWCLLPFVCFEKQMK